MFSVGWSEGVVILLLALFLFGPDKMTDFARTLGKLYAEYKNAKRRLELEVLYGKEVIDKDFIDKNFKNLNTLKKVTETNITEIEKLKIVDFNIDNLEDSIEPKYEWKSEYIEQESEEDINRIKNVEDVASKETKSEVSENKEQNKLNKMNDKDSKTDISIKVNIESENITKSNISNRLNKEQKEE